MATHYENAPILEALIDIRVNRSGVARIESLAAFQDSIREQYPRKDERFYVQGQFSVGPEVGASARQTLMGYAFSSEDRKQIVQVRSDGFTFSRLKPYGTWLLLRDEARRLWNVYRELVRPGRITRVAVRYINRIDIPMASVDYKDYLRTAPEVSPDLPQGLSSFFMQLNFPQPDFQGMLILTQTADPSMVPDMHSVVLDLDVFRQETGDVSDDDLWILLEKLRERKNEFFEGCITDRSRQLFGKRSEY